MSQKHLLHEIARLEGEIARIQRELEVLKRAAGVPSSKRTQSFAPIDKDARTREMPASQPPQPPQPSVPVSSDVVPTSKGSDRRMQSDRAGLSDTPVPTRKGATPTPGAGRYEFVGEGSTRRRR